MIYYISDTHFFHENILKLCNRPFKSIKDMNNQLIINWNKKVKPTDIIYCLGDFCFKCSYIEARGIFNQLNGRKILIRGNHDKISEKLPWDEVYTYKEIDDNKRFVVLFHYPIEEWNGYYRNSYHLYGHTHKDLSEKGNRFHVGVDTNNFEPKTLDELIADRWNKHQEQTAKHIEHSKLYSEYLNG